MSNFGGAAPGIDVCGIAALFTAPQRSSIAAPYELQLPTVLKFDSTTGNLWKRWQKMAEMEKFGSWTAGNFWLN